MSRTAQAPIRRTDVNAERGEVPRRRGLIVALSALAGFLLTVVWSAEFVDTTIGANVAGTLLGHEADGAAPGSVPAGVIFALVSGIGLGLAALRLVPDPLAKVARRFPNAPMVVMGVLVGGFLIGRPYPLFRQLFRDAAESGNPIYGAAAFVLQSLGNIVLVVLLFLLLSRLGRLRRWLATDPRRTTTLIAVSFIVAGVFTVLYWDVRLLDRREIIPWYPVAPWG
jgi:hypothetical protein